MLSYTTGLRLVSSLKKGVFSSPLAPPPTPHTPTHPHSSLILQLLCFSDLQEILPNSNFLCSPRNSCSQKQISLVAFKHLIRKEEMHRKAQAESSDGQFVTGRTEYCQFSEMHLDCSETLQHNGSLFCWMVLGILWKKMENEGKTETLHARIWRLPIHFLNFIKN